MSKKRRQYTEEFKESVVKLVTEQGYRFSEASRNLGVNVSVLRRWKDVMERGGDTKPLVAVVGKTLNFPKMAQKPCQELFSKN